MNDILRYAAFPQKFRRFQTVLGRIQFKINIMQQADDAPVICILSLFFGKPAHDTFDGQTVLEHDGHRYSIERTYPTGYGTLELSCAEVTR